MVDDLLGAMERPLEEAQSAMEERWAFIASADWGTDGEEWKEFRSSAYEEVIAGGRWGASEMKKLKRTGEMTEPCGTPVLTMRGEGRWLW